MVWEPGTGQWRFHSITRDFDYWPTLESIQISREEPTGIATFDCRVELAASGINAGLVFVEEDEHEVLYRDERIWAGHLKAVSEEYTDEVYPSVVLTGQDYTAKLDDTVIRRRRKRKKERLRRRVRWILKRMHWDLDGTDLSGLPDNNPFVEAYDYYGASIREALEHVSEEQRLHFFINLNNVFHIFREDIDNAPFSLDNDSPDYAASFPFSEFKYLKESTDLANAILVEPEKRKHSVWRTDPASIAIYGRQERFVSDSNIHRKAQARNFGDRALVTDSMPSQDMNLVCWEPGLAPGHRVHVVDALWGTDANYIVTRVNIGAIDPQGGEEGDSGHLRSEVTLTDRRRLSRLRRNRRSINKLARRRPGDTTDTDPYLLDQFGRTVESGEPEEGDPLTATPTWWKINWGELVGSYSGSVYTEGAVFGPTLVTSSPIKWVEGIAGLTNIPFTSTPCGPGPGAWGGTREQEQWVDLVTIPAHPAGMAGIYVDVQMDVNGGGYGTEGGIVYVGDTAPTVGRGGTPVGLAPANATTTLFIPAAAVPDAGDRLWVGVGPAWNPDYESFGAACATSYHAPVTTGQYHSGRINLINIANPRWAVTATDVPDLGETATPAKAPWDEPWQWRLIGTEGAPVWGMDGNAFYVEDGGVGIGLLGEREDDSQPYGVWSDVAYGIELEFEVDALGGTANLEITGTGEGEQAVGRVDMEADSVTVAGPTTTDSGSYAFSAATRYLACFDCRSGKVRGKAWAGPEPAAWLAECAMDETEDDADRLVLWVRAGTGQRVRVTRIRIMAGGGDGQRVVREWIGYASGIEKTFKTRHPFREGSLYARINGVNLPAAQERGDEAEFDMSYYPSAGAPVRATYVIDVGTGD